MDSPFALEVMRITKLENGYVLNAMGKTTACETPASLARYVRKWAEEVEDKSREFLGLKIPETNMPIPLSTEEQQRANNLVRLVNAVGQMPPDGRPGVMEQIVKAADAEEKQVADELVLDRQRSNLRTAIDSLFDDTIDEETFARAIRVGCPDLSGEEVGDALDQAHQEYNSGTVDAIDHERIERLKARSRGDDDTRGVAGENPDEVPVVQVRSADEGTQRESQSGREPGTDSQDSRTGLPQDGVAESIPGEPDLSVGGQVQSEPKTRPNVVRQRPDQGQLRRVRRRPLLEPGTYSEPRPEDVDKFDEEWPG